MQSKCLWPGGSWGQGVHCIQGLALGTRQSSPRTPAWRASGQEEKAAGSHQQACQALAKGEVCIKGAVRGDYEKAKSKH